MRSGPPHQACARASAAAEAQADCEAQAAIEANSASRAKAKADAAAADDKDGGKKVLPVVLAGINRALPFASASGGGSRSTAAVEALMESLFETVEASLGSFSAATQALLVLQQLLPGASSSTCSRFYSALYALSKPCLNPTFPR